jgi:hypothetical protein
MSIAPKKKSNFFRKKYLFKKPRRKDKISKKIVAFLNIFRSNKIILQHITSQNGESSFPSFHDQSDCASANRADSCSLRYFANKKGVKTVPAAIASHAAMVARPPFFPCSQMM